MGQSLTHSITVTSDTDTSRTLRLRIIYNSTAGITDSSNSFNLSGSWPNRSNTSVSINIPYGGGSQTIYDQTRTFTKQYGSSQTASFSASLSGINYWGGTIKRSGSATIPARTPGKPSAPGRPSMSNITSSSARASWSAPTNNGGAPISRYTLQVARNSSFTTGLSSVNTGTDRYFDIHGATRATKYYVRVRASNSYEWSDYSSVREFTTLPEVPKMANGGTATVTRNSATISGLSVSDNGGQAPTNVRVQYNTSQSTSGAKVVTRGSWGSVSITGLAANTTYYYRSAAYNSAGWSSYNSWRSFTTLDDAPDDIDTLTVSDIENTGMTFSWQAPNMNGATFQHYAWELSLSESFSTLVTSGTTTSTSRAFTGLTPGTRYYFRVRAVATPNSGGWDVLDATTTGIAPNSGLRMYTFVDGQRKQLELYTFIDGQRRKLRPMYAHDGVVETE